MFTRNVTGIAVMTLVKLLKYTTGRIWSGGGCEREHTIAKRSPGPTLPSYTSVPAWLITNLCSITIPAEPDTFAVPTKMFVSFRWATA
jgi:hypothetical protein